MNNKNKNSENKNQINYIFSIVVLSVVLCISLIYNFIGGFKFSNINKNYIEVGDDTTITLSNIGSETISLALDGSSLPNDVVKQNTSVVLPNIDMQNTVLRVKAKLLDGYVELSGFDFWELNLDDNYYYFNGEKYANQTIGICSEIKLPDAMLKNNYTYYVNITVEIFYLEGLNA